jgi:hypothetical protein
LYVWSGWRSAPDDNIEQALKHLESTDARPDEGKRVYSTPYGVWPGLFRRVACGHVGDWNEELYYNEDWEYSSRFLCQTPVIRQLANSLMVYSNHSSDDRVTARAGRREGNAAKLRSIAVVEAILPDDKRYRTVLIARLTAMYYSALLWACKGGYGDQKKAAGAAACRFLRNNCFDLPVGRGMKLFLLCVLAPVLTPRAARNAHAGLVRMARYLGATGSCDW